MVVQDVRDEKRVKWLSDILGVAALNDHAVVRCSLGNGMGEITMPGSGKIVSLVQSSHDGTRRSSIDTKTGVEHVASLTPNGQYTETEQSWSTEKGAYGIIAVLKPAAHLFDKDKLREMAASGMAAVRKTVPAPIPAGVKRYAVN